jgi:nitronate monooxygenase
MFLVSNEAMMTEAMRAGILGVFPSLNYRSGDELSRVINSLHQRRKEESLKGQFGVNLIVQQTNPLYKEHLRICINGRIPFYITSLGHPGEVIREAHAYGALVYCDVTNLKHAAKCAELGCDGFIAVTQGAGGHAGPYPLHVLVPALREQFPDMPVIAAGGIATGRGVFTALSAGAAGVSMGTRFIACTEATISEEYKNAVTHSGMESIMMTERLSGTPCAVIRTPYAEKLGEKQGFLERWLSNNPKTKKYFKMLVQYRGLKKLESAIKPGNYHNLWSAGQSVAFIDDVLPVAAIVDRLEKECEEAYQELQRIHRH